MNEYRFVFVKNNMINDMFGSLLPDKLCEEVYF